MSSAISRPSTKRWIGVDVLATRAAAPGRGGALSLSATVVCDRNSAPHRSAQNPSSAAMSPAAARASAAAAASPHDGVATDAASEDTPATVVAPGERTAWGSRRSKLAPSADPSVYQRPSDSIQ